MDTLDLEELTRRVESRNGPGFEIEALSPRHSRVTLWGELPLGWAGRFSTGLAERGIDTREANATHSEPHGWIASFELEHRPGQDLAAIDYLGLCRQEHTAAAAELALDSYTLQRDPSGLKLTIWARDELGFLGALLGQLAFFSLFPAAMHITTVGGMAVDTFELHGLSGRAPGGAIETALVDFLSRNTRRSSRRDRDASR